MTDTPERALREALEAWPCGHPRTPENTQSIGTAGVRCRICRNRIANKSARRRATGLVETRKALTHERTRHAELRKAAGELVAEMRSIGPSTAVVMSAFDPELSALEKLLEQDE